MTARPETVVVGGVAMSLDQSMQSDSLGAKGLTTHRVLNPSNSRNLEPLNKASSGMRRTYDTVPNSTKRMLEMATKPQSSCEAQSITNTVQTQLN